MQNCNPEDWRIHEIRDVDVKFGSNVEILDAYLAVICRIDENLRRI
jgi:hypothetical protein